jgi:hypothetical protein
MFEFDRTCYRGSISDADSTAHEHDPFDRIQKVRVNAHEKRNVRQRSRCYNGDLGALARVPCLTDRGRDHLDGWTIIGIRGNAPSHRIRVGRRKSFHTAQPTTTVDLGIVSRWSEERCDCAAIHFDVLWGCERVQASRSIDLGILNGSVPVCLANGLVNNTHRTCSTAIIQLKRREGVY